MSLAATRTFPAPLPADTYVCGRCGARRIFNPSRGARPDYCTDCQLVDPAMTDPDWIGDQEPLNENEIRLIRQKTLFGGSVTRAQVLRLIATIRALQRQEKP